MLGPLELKDLNIRPGSAKLLTQEQIDMLWTAVGGRDRVYKQKLQSVRVAVFDMASSSKTSAHSMSARLSHWIRKHQHLFNRYNNSAPSGPS